MQCLGVIVLDTVGDSCLAYAVNWRTIGTSIATLVDDGRKGFTRETDGLRH